MQRAEKKLEKSLSHRSLSGSIEAAYTARERSLKIALKSSKERAGRLERHHESKRDRRLNEDSADSLTSTDARAAPRAPGAASPPWLAPCRRGRS